MKKIYIYILFSSILCNIVHANDKNYIDKNASISQNLVDWVLDRIDIQKPRGGTTKGIKTKLDNNPSKYFIALTSGSKKNKKEMDRLAILSMAGEYKVSFEFTELYGSTKDYKLDNPYKSWGTEIVIVIDSKDNFISLQHIMVMYIKNKQGKIKGPYVQKHWRQDWQYEDKTILDYKSKKNWINNNKKNIKGTWSQTVYQVDDTPRYESYGKWVHKQGASKWVSDKTPRPLPRREFSVRSDYDLLVGINKITVMSWGWIMEEMNDKLSLNNIYIGSEFGIARYQRIKEFKFQPGYEYWNQTKKFWKIVRIKWRELVQKEQKICMNKLVDNDSSYIHYFQLAEDFKNNKDLISSKNNIASITNKFLKNCE